jgi:hypothetical protein
MVRSLNLMLTCRILFAVRQPKLGFRKFALLPCGTY